MAETPRQPETETPPPAYKSPKGPPQTDDEPDQPQQRPPSKPVGPMTTEDVPTTRKQ